MYDGKGLLKKKFITLKFDKQYLKIYNKKYKNKFF